MYTLEPTPPFRAKDPGAVPGIMTRVFPDIPDCQLNISSPAGGNKTIPAHMPMAHVIIYDISPKFVDHNSRVNITVYGQNFERNTTYCHFSSHSSPVPAIVQSHALVLCEFDGSIVEPGPISVAVGLSNLRPSVSTAAFTLVTAPSISSIFPKRGPLEGGTTILIMGTGFIDKIALYCHFDGYSKVPAVRLTGTMVNCKTPPSRRGQTSELQLSINASIFSSNSIDFLYQDMPELGTISPPYGDVGGGTTVYLHGRSLNSSEDHIECTFGSVRALSTTIVNATSAIVEPPPSTTGPRGVQVKCTSGGEVITSAELSYQYLLTPYTSRITPQMGLATSQTTVLVDGTGFSDKYPMTCNFGEVSSSATVKSGSQVECIAPPQRSGLVNLNVAFGASPVGNSAVVFKYIAEPVLQQVIPPLGSEMGSTRLLIVGEQFSRHADFNCAFSREDDLVPVTTLAFWVSEQSVICVTPRNSPGPTVLQLAVVEPRVFSVVPPYSSGVSNITVVVNGAGFIDSDLARCSLGPTSVRPIRVESDSRIVCEFPRQFHSGAFPVRVTMNNQDFTTDTVLFTLYPPIVVDYATPLYGLLDKVDTRVDLVGHNFHKLVALICQIHVDDTIHTVTATYASPSLSTCFVSAPTQPYSINASVSISARLLVKEVTHDEVIFAAPFLYLASPILLTSFPNVLISTGGQSIYFHGVNFAPAVDMVCQFESYFPYDRVPLQVINSTNGFCIAPERAPGPVEVRICFKDQEQCSSDSLVLSYVRLPVVRSLMASGLKSGNPLVTVVGKDFYNVPMQCQFDGLTTPVTFVNRSTLVCPHSPLQDRCTSFSLFVDGINILEEPLEFCTWMAPMVNMIRPTAGPDKGGTRTLISGGPFTVNGGYWCHFGEIHVRAAYLSTTQIFCISPPSQSRTVNFSVSGNNFSEFDIPHLRFTYRPAPVVIAVNPTRGSQDGQYHVTIQGLNFVRSAGLRCRFGDSHIVAGKWLSDTAITCVVPSHSPGWVDIQVTNNLQDYSVETLRFEYVVSPIVLDFEPTTMYAQNPKELTIFGRNFQNSTNLRCIIGNDLTIATFVSDTKLRCAPANLVESAVVVGVIDLKLSMIGSFVKTRLKVLDDGVWYLRPRTTSVRGRTPLVLSRSRNDQPLNIEVYYGRFCLQPDRVCSELTPTDMTEPSTYKWFPPRWTGPDLMGVVEFFRVTNTSLTPSIPITTFPFRYHREVELSKLTPPIGSIAGGTIVTLVGAYFQDSRNLSCVLNGVAFTPAHFITDTMISCTIPPFVSGPREIGVFVSLNGLEVSDTSLSFKYEEEPSVFSIFPVGGPVTGFTTVSVKGAYFFSTTRSVCSFGQHIVSAIVVSSTEVTCTVHPSSWNSEGSVLFRFSSNGQEFSKEKVSYLFYKVPSMLLLSPRVGSINGGTIITISWSQVVPGEMLEHLTCEIGSFVVECNLISGTSVGLTVPQAPGGLEGPVKVRVSLNGQNYVEGSPFWYLKESDVYFNSSSTHRGGTIVKVDVSQVPPSGDIWCFFGDVRVGAQRLTPYQIGCKSPPFRPGQVKLTVQGEGIVGSSLSFTFLLDFEVESISPTRGSSAGGTEVNLTLSTAVDVFIQERIMCRFGAIFVQAQTIQKNQVTCVSPLGPQNEARVQVSVSALGVSISTEFPLWFTYYDPPMILSVSPDSLKTTGGEMVILSGKNFIAASTIQCLFSDSILIPATFISSTSITCIAPPRRRAGYVSLEMTTNGVDYTESYHSVYYFDYMDVLSVVPELISTSGGTELYIKLADGSTRHLRYSCKIGGQVVKAEYTNETHVGCRTPAVSKPSQVVVKISNNDLDYSEFNLAFAYVDPLFVSRIYPVSGDIGGGQFVTIIGGVFTAGAENLQCRFGNTVVQATVLSSSTALCVAP
eukprot:jgi/Phyca11/97558/e_gw1.2.453.1